VTFEVLMAVNVLTVVLSVVTPCLVTYVTDSQLVARRCVSRDSHIFL
jgi:hypothetical protein